MKAGYAHSGGWRKTHIQENSFSEICAPSTKTQFFFLITCIYAHEIRICKPEISDYSEKLIIDQAVLGTSM